MKITGLILSYAIAGLIGSECLGQTGRFEKQLSALTPDHPEQYRDLAEEVAMIPRASASDLAVRLYLIAAAKGEGKIRRSALRGLIVAARNDSERQKFRILAFMNDPQFADALQSKVEMKALPADSNPNGATAADDSRATLLDALLSLRQGKIERARKKMEDPSVRKLFATFQETMTLKEFESACGSAALSDQQLFQLLSIDLKIRFGNSNSDVGSSTNETSWDLLLKEKIPLRIQQVDFSNVTEFNPDHSVYRSGGWRAPQVP